MNDDTFHVNLTIYRSYSASERSIRDMQSLSWGIKPCPQDRRYQAPRNHPSQIDPPPPADPLLSSVFHIIIHSNISYVRRPSQDELSSPPIEDWKRLSKPESDLDVGVEEKDEGRCEGVKDEG